MTLPIDPPIIPQTASPQTAGSRPAQPQPMMALLVEPEAKKKKKKKKKKNKEGIVSKLVGKLALGSAEAWAQMGEAMTDAAKKYAKKHKKSRDKKKAGWRKDVGKNMMSATGELLSGSAKAPAKFVKALVKKDKKKKKKKDEAEVRTVMVEPIVGQTVEAPAQART